MPPHHSGLWNREAFLQLPSYFPVTVNRILTEPLAHRVPWFYVFLQHFKLNRLYKFFKNIPPGITNRLLLPLRWLVQGKCVLAIFEKTEE